MALNTAEITVERVRWNLDQAAGEAIRGVAYSANIEVGAAPKG